MSKFTIVLREARSNMSRFQLLFFAISAFWFLALFPGRLGYDYALAIRMIQNGESTDWWTALFFWYLRLTTFWGSSIFLAALVGYCALLFSVYFLINSLPYSKVVRERTLLILISTPFVGVFGLTVSHDVFQTAGILLFIAAEIRIYLKKVMGNTLYLTILIVAALESLTAQIGICFIAVQILILTLRKNFKTSVYMLLITLIVFALSPIGISTDFMKNAKSYALIADMKCVAQHPEARISSGEWDYLRSIAPEADWKSPISCTAADPQIAALNFLRDDIPIDSELVRNYLSISSKNPAIVLMAHIQRSRGALPPPFFQGPDNQVILDPTVPIGQNTNIALQTGPELLHPSIDEPSVNKRFAISKPLEMLAQTPTFLINQASWFWGWGGFWLWPISIFFLAKLKIRRFSDLAFISYPIVVLHSLMFIVGPGPLGRYYMSTILLGIACSIIPLIDYLTSENRKRIQ